jgi:hypothetical protein
MIAKGLQPLTLKELLHLGVKYPDLQRKDWIVALGSKWRDPYGDVGVPYLYGDGGGRYLNLHWLGSDWYPHWRFAARRASSTLEPSVTSKPLPTSDTLTLEILDKKLNRIIKLLSRK